MLIRRHPNPPLRTKLMHTLLSFSRLHKPKSLNSAIQGLVQTAQFRGALQLYADHWNRGLFRPDNFTFPYVLKAAAHLHNPTPGLLVHGHTVKTGFQGNLFVGNSLILFYGGLGCLGVMQDLFDEIPQRNVVTWTAVISAYAEHDRFDCAVEHFRAMQSLGVRPNSFTMASILPGVSGREEVVQIHGLLVKSGFESDAIVSTALVDSYAKCGSISSACSCFRELPVKNVLSWNAIISGCAQNGKPRRSMQLFVEMQELGGIRPDSFSLVAILLSCASLASLKHGKEVHSFAYRAGLQREVFVGNGLINMYGKCGDMKLAKRVFDKMPKRDVYSWTALINCHGLHGHGEEAISIFEKMRKRVTPNGVTLAAVLSACSRACLVDEGFKYFEAMSAEFGIEPTMKHYVCMVDMVGRAGLLAEALIFVSEMRIRPDYGIWEALLGAASFHGHAQVAEIVVKQLLESRHVISELYLQLSNIYARAGNWEDVVKLRGRMRRWRAQPCPGLSWVR